MGYPVRISKFETKKRFTGIKVKVVTAFDHPIKHPAPKLLGAGCLEERFLSCATAISHNKSNSAESDGLSEKLLSNVSFLCPVSRNYNESHNAKA